MQTPVFKSFLIALLVYLLSAGGSYALTTYLYAPDSTSPTTPIATPAIGGGLNIDPSAPRTSQCPISGAMFTSAEQKVWESRRPLFVMIENSVDARPQSGLNSADVIYEAIAEGGITRFGAVYYCGVAARDTIVGPVRSARTHFVNLASEYNYPLYTHVGGANCSSGDGGKTCTTDKRVQALEQINTYGWGGSKGNDLNQFSIGFPTFWRDYERIGRTVATEHTMYSSTEKLWKYATNTRKWTNKSPDGKLEWSDKFTPFTFKDDATDKGTVSKVSFGFWESYHDMDVVWNYDSAGNLYRRDNGGSPHTDLNDKSTLTAKVIVVQLVKELGPLDEHKHLLYEVVGTGKGYVFQDGTATEMSWTKKDRESRTVFTDKKGKKLAFNRGKIMIEILPVDNTVTY
ncbi:MAG: hypothetical protein UX62_C0008G0010 [Microgenomates group bacterium GW2011_GWA2_46_7]|nr:MAG: hypothetical protein UX62_C0008G0010 [Microgenomates group bacterium GW2011_GWA2_46_7]